MMINAGASIPPIARRPKMTKGQQDGQGVVFCCKTVKSKSPDL